MPTVVPPRGMRDVLPEDFFLRDHLISEIRRVYETYGYSPMDTPAPERLEYLTAKAGGETEQLMFKILKRAQDAEAPAGSTDLADMALRYDLTVSLCRFYATNHHLLPAVFRRYQIGPVWRADRPQRGRLREFFQCDVDIIGTDHRLAECEVILATTETLRRLEIGDHFVKLSDRRLLPIVFGAMGMTPQQVHRAIVTIDKLDKIGVDGVVKEAGGYLTEAEILSAFTEFVRGAASPDRSAGVSVAALGPWAERCADALEPILGGLRHVIATLGESSEVPLRIEFWPTLARGMAYYTGPIFEIWNATDPFSLAGGGRYDGLVGQFLGREVPACGFSIGFERIFTVLKERSKASARRSRAQALVALRAEGAEAVGLRTAARLRASGIPTELYPFVSDRKRQFTHAEQLGMRWIILLGADGALELVDATDRSRFQGDLDAVTARIRQAP